MYFENSVPSTCVFVQKDQPGRVIRNLPTIFCIFQEMAASMRECGVCSEEYEATGNMCPKMLPCSHTVCLRCLQQLVAGKSEVMCPECRQINEVPEDGGATGFVTNRYVLEFISYLQKSDAANLTAPDESTENLRKALRVREA